MQLPGWRYRPSEWRVAAAVRPFGVFLAPRRAFGPACVGGVGRCFGRCLMVLGGMGIDGTAALARSVRYSTAVIAVELLETASASWRQAARQPARAGGRRWRRRRRRAPCLRIVVLCDAAIFWCLWWHHAGLSLGSPVFRRRRAAVAVWRRRRDVRAGASGGHWVPRAPFFRCWWRWMPRGGRGLGGADSWRVGVVGCRCHGVLRLGPLSGLWRMAPSVASI